MAGHYPDQFGPPRPPRRTGPFGTAAKVLCCVLPVLSIGLLGFVPSLALAVRRRRPADVAGAALFGALFVLMVVCAGIAGPDGKHVVANGLGMAAMIVLIFTPPAHFLLMHRRSRWQPAPPPPFAFGPPVPVPGPVPGPAAVSFQQPYPVYQGEPPADDLQQLGELLRRQAEGGGGR
ncbi:hypothetical protein P3T36_001367 [Kitasatospora sp. MAP12-15]|uniref:hypothetical protein n=1 Tax=unclassified Kitasatospora TaxID=2633591 RepID=UPI0024764922|nr:hypothetical protein [Kitasatospora sp. MAP12-44]MDH6112484.1 hypothetical protein [Kitasatospora sp. MAP12-44]